MKPHGSKFEYEKDRINDLIRAYHELIDQSSHIRLPLIYKKVVNMPSARFWVSEERAAIVIAAMFKSESIDDVLKGMRKNKKEMFHEIYKRALELRTQQPSLSVFDIAFQVVRQPAPKFYLTPGSARVYIYKAKKEWFEARKRKLRHLF
jgi:hypothetical protein